MTKISMTAAIRQAHQGIDKLVAILTAKHDIKLTPRQIEVLLTIADKPDSNTTQIARIVGIDTPTTSDIIRRMRTFGWVKVKPDPTDPRARRLELTKRGHEVVGQARHIHKQAEDKIDKAVTREKTFADRLRAIAGLAENDA